MFSLIITIISIALVAALALATLYYGGSAFNKGSTGATAAKLINEGQQINGAIQILRADRSANTVVGTDPTAVSGLASSYLSQVPTAWLGTTLLTVGTVETTANVGADVCAEINKRAGLVAPVTTASASVYGCTQPDAVTDGKAFYKF